MTDGQRPPDGSRDAIGHAAGDWENPDMAFELKKVLEHGTTNPIVARLSLQILEILKHCNTSQDIRDQVGDLYMNSLQKKLLRCWEIEERFKKEFAAAVSKYKPPE
jgi:hypothetical protein